MKNDKFWWMVGVFMMSALFAFSLPASADPRIEVNANNTFCHILNGNPANDDDETFDGGCNPFIAVDDTGGNSTAGYGKSEQSYIPASVVPHVFQYGVRERYKGNRYRWRAQLTDADMPGETCTLVDSNNTQYDATTWKTVVMWHENGHLTQYIYCSGGQAN